MVVVVISSARTALMRLLLIWPLIIMMPVPTEAGSDVTYQLMYDGTVPPNLVSQDETKDTNFSAIPSFLVSEISKKVALDVIKIYSQENEEEMDEKDLNQRCYEALGSRCAVDFVGASSHLLLHMNVHVYPQEERSSLLLRLDVSLTSSSESHRLRHCLVQLIPMLDELFAESISSVWSIQHRPSALEMQASWQRLSSSASDNQLEKESHAGSMEELILVNARLKGRKRIKSVRSSISQNELEVWQYDDSDFPNPVRSLFVNGKLQSTTLPAGNAHAEALVHPALIACTNLKRVLVVSLEPSAVVKEVLKHKSVKEVVVLGADEDAVEMVRNFLPPLQDCAFLKRSKRNCMDQKLVIFITADMESWLTAATDEAETPEEFDIILVDVPNGSDDWLSFDLHEMLAWLLMEGTIEHSMLVVSAGSEPSMLEMGVNYSPTGRDLLLQRATKEESAGGLEYDTVFVYDEPLAKPLPSAFIALIPDSKGTYSRFFRKNSVMVDTDLVQKLWFSGGRPTVVYDGPTHDQYMLVSRAWENWYCSVPPWRDLPLCKNILANWFDPSYHHYSTEVRRDPVKGRSLFTTEDVPAGHFILPNDAGLSLHFQADQWDALNQFVEDFEDAEMYRQLRDFVVAYGYQHDLIGETGWTASFACNNTFTNHACSEKDVTVVEVKQALVDEHGNNETGFSPPLARRSLLFGTLAMTARDMKAGEEIMCDYASFRSYEEKEFLEFLNRVCSDGVGLVPVDADDGGGAAREEL